jgi:hypothetical protein
MQTMSRAGNQKTDIAGKLQFAGEIFMIAGMLAGSWWVPMLGLWILIAGMAVELHQAKRNRKFGT